MLGYGTMIAKHCAEVPTCSAEHLKVHFLNKGHLQFYRFLVFRLIHVTINFIERFLVSYMYNIDHQIMYTKMQIILHFFLTIYY